MSAATGIDLAAVLEETCLRHAARKCKFADGHLERLRKRPSYDAFMAAFNEFLASPEVTDLVADIEAEETECALREGIQRKAA